MVGYVSGAVVAVRSTGAVEAYGCGDCARGGDCTAVGKGEIRAGNGGVVDLVIAYGVSVQGALIFDTGAGKVPEGFVGHFSVVDRGTERVSGRDCRSTVTEVKNVVVGIPAAVTFCRYRRTIRRLNTRV